MSNEVKRNNKKTIYLNDKTYDNLDNYYGRMHDKEATISSKISESINDLMNMLDNTINIELTDRFTVNECMLMVDMMNGVSRETAINTKSSLLICVEDSCLYEYLDQKWGVKKEDLISKINDLTVFQAYAIYFLGSKFWSDCTGTFDYYEVAKLFNCRTYIMLQDSIDKAIEEELKEDSNKVTIKLTINFNLDKVKEVLPTIEKYKSDSYEYSIEDKTLIMNYYHKS